jgi:lauroyl/myristoyl acyltransferase
MFSLAAISNAPVLPLFCFSNSRHQTQLTVEPEIEVAKGDVEVSLEAYVRQLERYVRAYPDQYRNWQFP